MKRHVLLRALAVAAVLAPIIAASDQMRESSESGERIHDRKTVCMIQDTVQPRDGIEYAFIGTLTGPVALSSCCGAGMLMRSASCMGTAPADREPSRAPEPPGGSSGARMGQEAVCPVDGMKVQVTADTPSAEYGGRRYYFCSDADRRTFLERPDRYVVR